MAKLCPPSDTAVSRYADILVPASGLDPELGARLLSWLSSAPGYPDLSREHPEAKVWEGKWRKRLGIPSSHATEEAIHRLQVSDGVLLEGAVSFKEMVSKLTNSLKPEGEKKTTIKSHQDVEKIALSKCWEVWRPALRRFFMEALAKRVQPEELPWWYMGETSAWQHALLDASLAPLLPNLWQGHPLPRITEEERVVIWQEVEKLSAKEPSFPGIVGRAIHRYGERRVFTAIRGCRGSQHPTTRFFKVLMPPATCS